MSKHKILFLDIDGTIMRPDETIEDSTKEAIRQVQAQGVDVFLATGRPLHEIMEIGEELNIHSFIGYNGAYAIHKGQDVFVEPMLGETIQFFLEVAEERGHEIVMYTRGKNVWTSMDKGNVKEFIQTFHLKHNVLFEPKYRDEILGVTLINVSPEDVKRYEAVGNLHLATVNVDIVRDHSYDVIRDSVNKGVAVQKILDLLGYNKEEAIAFGDAMNDKEMLSLVGVGVAMGNARPELLKYSDRQTTSVMDSGVYNGLKELGLVK